MKVHPNTANKVRRLHKAGFLSRHIAFDCDLPPEAVRRIIAGDPVEDIDDGRASPTAEDLLEQYQQDSAQEEEDAAVANPLNNVARREFERLEVYQQMDRENGRDQRTAAQHYKVVTGCLGPFTLS